ncbi:hypothetical protein H8959_018405 [Pygathrix nigripes]
MGPEAARAAAAAAAQTKARAARRAARRARAREPGSKRGARQRGVSAAGAAPDPRLDIRGARTRQGAKAALLPPLWLPPRACPSRPDQCPQPGSSQSSAHGRTCSRSTRPPSETGSRRASMHSLSPISTMPPAMSTASSASGVPRSGWGVSGEEAPGVLVTNLGLVAGLLCAQGMGNPEPSVS